MRVLVGITVLPLCLLPASFRVQQPVAEVSQVGVFQPAPCPIEIPGAIDGETVKCGWVEVPEFHDRQGQRTLRLAVAIFPALGDAKRPDPLVVSPPGPGTSAIGSIGPVVASAVGAALRAERDVVLVENRGLPLSKPALLCDEVVDSALARLGQDLSGRAALPSVGDGYEACRKRLSAEGIDTRAYTFKAISDDVAMVMTALGVDRFNVYGTSAGAIVGQYLLRDHPQRLRAVVIDSVPALGRRLLQAENPRNVAQILRALFAQCAADAACATAYPGVEEEFDAVFKKLNAKPVTVPVTSPRSGETVNAVLNGDRLAEVLLMAAAQTSWLPRLPGLIHGVAQGNEKLLRDLAWGLTPPRDFSFGLGASAMCADFYTFSENDILFAGLYPAFERGVATASWGPAGLLRECEAWGYEKKDAAARRVATGDVPTLILAGEMDVLCPPAWARDVARSLANVHLFEVPGFAHSPTFAGECPASLALQFLADPEKAPDASCLKGMKLSFALPE